MIQGSLPTFLGIIQPFLSFTFILIVNPFSREETDDTDNTDDTEDIDDADDTYDTDDTNDTDGT